MKKFFVNVRSVVSSTRAKINAKVNRLMVMALVAMGAVPASAAGQGDGGGQFADPTAGAEALEEVGGYIWAYLPAVQNIVYALGGVVFIAGVYNAAHAFQNGDQDAKGKAIALIGGSIALIVGVTLIPKLFGYTG